MYPTTNTFCHTCGQPTPAPPQYTEALQRQPERRVQVLEREVFDHHATDDQAQESSNHVHVPGRKWTELPTKSTIYPPSIKVWTRTNPNKTTDIAIDDPEALSQIPGAFRSINCRNSSIVTELSSILTYWASHQRKYKCACTLSTYVNRDVTFFDTPDHDIDKFTPSGWFERLGRWFILFAVKTHDLDCCCGIFGRVREDNWKPEGDWGPKFVREHVRAAPQLGETVDQDAFWRDANAMMATFGPY